MTKKQWQTSTDSTRMAAFVQSKTSDRKLRLFACSCCRRVWKSLTLKPVRTAVEVSERFADGAATEAEREDAHRRAIVRYTGMLHRTVKRTADPQFHSKMMRMARAVDAANPAPMQATWISGHGADEALKALSPQLLRCIVGNPYRQVAFDPNWLTSDVVAIGWGIYSDRAFDRLPILADALMDAGCEDDDIIGHCRANGPHDRGCWVVDLVLGK